jgi:uracil phosphoribosyltransferase
MPLTHFTDRHLVRVLATQTRRVDVSPHELSRSHVALGRFLGGELLERLPLEECTIQHPQGERTGFQVQSEQDIALVCFMRAGMYVAEGVREVLPTAPLFHVSPRRGQGLSSKELDELGPSAGRTFVLIDSVVNTGASLESVLEQLDGARIFVLTLVGPVHTAERLVEQWPDVELLYARVSTNQYTGKGGTDTGNRLFGTWSRS